MPNRFNGITLSRIGLGAMRMADVQQGVDTIHAALDRYSILIIFQAMDAAGKDGTIKHVMSGINPQGCQVYSFKQPSAEELDHDYLWRINRSLPERGRIGIFNRSHYEDVLIAKVHPEIILSNKLPGVETINDIDVRRREFPVFRCIVQSLHESIFLFGFRYIEKEFQDNRSILRQIAFKIVDLSITTLPEVGINVIYGFDTW